MTTTSAAPGGSTTTWVPPAMQPVRWASYEGGTFVLHGTVPDQATGDALVSRFAAAAGMDHVVASYTVAAGAPLVDDEPLYAHDAIQVPGQLVRTPAAGVAVPRRVRRRVARQPHPHGRHPRLHRRRGECGGSNLTLSKDRVDAIAFYLVSKGIAVERLAATGYGSAFPVAPDDTEDGRAKNRRVEFTLHHLLG